MKALLKNALLCAVVLFCGAGIKAQIGLKPLTLPALGLPPVANVLPLTITQAFAPVADAMALPASCNRLTGTCQVLPVQLLEFSALRADEETAALTWRTEAEVAVNGYYTERSVVPASAFSSRGFTAASTTAALRKTYRFTDPNNLNVISYYRLKILHADGTTTYSNVVPVPPVKDLSALRAYPSPASTMLNIRVSVPKNTAAVITWNDAAGKKVREQNIRLQAGTNYLKEDVSGLADGNYFITVTIPDAPKLVTGFFKVKG